MRPSSRATRSGLISVIAFVAAGCVVQGSPPPLKGADGVTINSDAGTVSLNEGEVPVVPSCMAGQLVGMTADGWKCLTPAQPEVIQGGTGILVAANMISFDASTIPRTEAWPGTIPYAQVTDAPPVTWATVGATVMPTDNWPGAVPYSQVTGAPDVNWATVSETVQPADQWPGTIPYSQVTNAPPVSWGTVGATVMASDTWPGTIPYLQVTGAPPVTWGTVSMSVTGSTAWPGTVPYSRVTGAPSVNWSTIQSTVTNSTSWPGTVPYAQVTGAPSVDWSTVQPTVTGSTTWPGTIPYAQVTGTPAPYTDAQAQAAVTWSTVSPTVPNGGVSNTMLANSSINVNAQSPLTGGGTVSLGGTVNVGLGTVPVANGGTGAGSFTGNGVIVANGGGTALSSVAPGAAGNVLLSNGSSWVSQSMSTSGLARVTTAAMTVYVRTDGNDTSCNGTADAPAAAAPNCAFATPQAAIDSLPQVLTNPVTVQIAAGTYYDTSSATTLLELRRLSQKAAGTLTVSGISNGAVILSGLRSGADANPTASEGVLVASPSSPASPTITVKNITVQSVLSAGVDVENSRVTLNNVSVQTVSNGSGILCQSGSDCVLVGSVSVSGASVNGVLAQFGSLIEGPGSITSNSNGEAGIALQANATLTAGGAIVANSNGGPGLLVGYGSTAMLNASASFSSNTGGTVQALQPPPATVLVMHNSTLFANAGLSVSAPGTSDGLVVDGNSSATLYAAATVSIDCSGAGGTIGVGIYHSSHVATGGPQGISISTCSTGFVDESHSDFSDDSGGARTLSVTTSLTADGFSTFTKGAFSVTCPVSTFVECN